MLITRPYIAYYRVSTDEQGRSGLGFNAQREAVQRFIQPATLTAEYTEIESGKRDKNRPQLMAALAQCKKLKAMLVIAKLDRLSRNVHFISGLMESWVEFSCCDMPGASKMNIQMMAVWAEHEREMISDRTKAGLASVKRELAEKGSRTSKKGNVFTALGNPRLEEARVKATAALREHVNLEVVHTMREYRANGLTLQAIADKLNRLGLRTPRGAQWYPMTISAELRRSAGTDLFRLLANQRR